MVDLYGQEYFKGRINPDIFEFSSGVWLRFPKGSEAEKAREIDLLFRDLTKIPLLNKPLPGDSTLEFKLSSGSSLFEGLELKKTLEFDPILALLKSVTLKIDINCDGQMTEAIEEDLPDLLEYLFDRQRGQVFLLLNLAQEFEVKIAFDSWEDLPKEQKERITGIHPKKPLLNLYDAEERQLFADISSWLEQDCLCYLLINESTFLELEFKLPGLTDWVLSQETRK